MRYRIPGLMVALLLCTTHILDAQKTNQVVLKNGSVILGEVTELKTEGNVSVNDLAGNTWVFPMSEVREITSVPEKYRDRNGGFGQGWVSMTTIGFLAGSSAYLQHTPFSFQTSFGYRQGSGLYTGLSAGIEYWNISHIPAMIDIQYALNNNSVSPVLVARGGYSFPGKGPEIHGGNEISYSGGPLGSVGVGLKIRSMQSLAWDVSVLYRYMQTSYTEYYEWNDSERTYTDIHNRLELRIGFYLD